MSHPLPNMLETTMEKIKNMVNVNSVIGDPITTPDGVTIIPVSKISYGFGGGGSFITSPQPIKTGRFFIAVSAIPSVTAYACRSRYPSSSPLSPCSCSSVMILAHAASISGSAASASSAPTAARLRSSAGSPA